MAARDVEFNYTASDKTGPANESVRRKMRETGERAEKDLGDNVAKGILRGGISAAPALTGVIGATAPVIGGLMGAAIIGGAGFLGIIGGIAAVSKDPRVSAAGHDLADTLLSGLKEDAEPFVAPILEQVDKIEDRFQGMRGRIRSIFSHSADFLDPLVDGVLNGVDGILRGVDALVSKGKPVMEAFGNAFSIIGDATGDAFETISGGADGAAKSLTGFATVVAETIRVLGYLVRGLEETANVVGFVPEKIVALERSLGLLAEPPMIAAHNIGGMSAATEEANRQIVGIEGPIVSFTQAINDLAKGERDAFDATTRVGEALATANEAVKKNGRTLDENTAKGRANRQALSGLRDALIGQYNAAVQVNGEGPKTDAIAASNRQKFINLAVAMGQSKREAQRLATQMGLIPPKKTIRIDTNSAQARAAIKSIQSAINAVKGKTVEVRVFYSKQGEVLYGSGGGRQASQFDARDGFTFAGPGDNRSRTGGPAPTVQLDSNVSVFLDGKVFDVRTERTVRSANSTLAWRQKVGLR